jgi:hypothetical protein
MLTDTQQDQIENWAAKVKDVNERLAVARQQAEEGRLASLKLKHGRDELEEELFRLVSDGPYKEDKPDPQGKLWDDDDMMVPAARLRKNDRYDDDATDKDEDDDYDEEIDEDSIDNLEVTGKVKNILSKLKISTFSQLQVIVDGSHESYPNGLVDVAELDVDARNQLIQAFSERNDGKFADSQVSYPVSMPKPVPGAPKISSHSVKVRLKIQLNELDMSEGDEMEAVLTPTGQALVAYGDGKEALLEHGEFSLC